MTRTDESSLSRLASTLPAAPPPTIRKSTPSPSRPFDESDMFILHSLPDLELYHRCQLRDRGRASEHAVGVGRVLGYLLDDVPVLDDLAVLEAEEVHKRPSAVVGIV